MTYEEIQIYDYKYIKYKINLKNTKIAFAMQKTISHTPNTVQKCIYSNLIET